MKKLTEEQVEEVKRRLAIPQAKRVIAYYMGIPLSQVLAVAHSLRGPGRPPNELGDPVDTVTYSPQTRSPSES